MRERVYTVYTYELHIEIFVSHHDPPHRPGVESPGSVRSFSNTVVSGLWEAGEGSRPTGWSY